MIFLLLSSVKESTKSSSPVLVVAFDKTGTAVVPFGAAIGNCSGWPRWGGLEVLIGAFSTTVEFLWPSMDICGMGVLIVKVFLVDRLIVAGGRKVAVVAVGRNPS